MKKQEEQAHIISLFEIWYVGRFPNRISPFDIFKFSIFNYCTRFQSLKKMNCMLPPNWIWLMLSAFAGGVLTAIILPITNYFFVRTFNHRRVNVRSGSLIRGLKKNHWNLPLILTNNSYSSLKNVIAYLTISYSEEDLRADPNIITFNAVTPLHHQLTLSWSKQLGDRIVPYTDINQGESADLNLFRFHQMDNGITLLQIPSENGFYHAERGRIGRLLLNGDRDYEFYILITADNMTPLKKKYIFNNNKIDPNITDLS